MAAILQLKASKLIVYFMSFTVVIFTILNVPVNTSFLIIKGAFLLRCKLGKTIISIRTMYQYAPPNHSSPQTFMRFLR